MGKRIQLTLAILILLCLAQLGTLVNVKKQVQQRVQALSQVAVTADDDTDDSDDTDTDTDDDSDDTSDCETYFDTLLNDNDLYNSPSDVLIDGVQEYCESQTDGVSKLNVPYYCFYTILNLMMTITSGSDKTASIQSFCEQFSDAYTERESLVDYFYNETDETEFESKCVYYYENVYDSSNAEFDPIDISGYLESMPICSSLYEITVTMDSTQQGQLSYIMNYFYLLSLQLFIDTNQAIDYGDCNEYNTELLGDVYNFCLDGYDWSTLFPLWTETQVQVICSTIETSFEDSGSTDYCTYVTISVYEYYELYIDKMLDTVISGVTDTLDSKLNSAVSSAKQDITTGSDSIDYTDSATSDSDSDTDSDSDSDDTTTTTTLVQQRSSIVQQRVQLIDDIDSVMNFICDLPSDEQKLELRASTESMRSQLKDQTNLLKQIDESTDYQIVQRREEAVTQFVQNLLDNNTEALTMDIRYAENYTYDGTPVSEFIEMLFSDGNETDDSVEPIKVTFTDVLAVSELIDEIVEIAERTDPQTVKDYNLTKTTIMLIIEDIIASRATALQAQQVEKFFDMLYLDQGYLRESTYDIEQLNKKLEKVLNYLSFMKGSGRTLSTIEKVEVYVQQLIEDKQIHKKAEALLSFIDKMYATTRDKELSIMRNDIEGILYEDRLSMEELEQQKEEENQLLFEEEKNELISNFERVNDYISQIMEDDPDNENVEDMSEMINEIMKQIKDSKSFNLTYYLEQIFDLSLDSISDPSVVSILQYIEAAFSYEYVWLSSSSSDEQVLIADYITDLYEEENIEPPNEFKINEQLLKSHQSEITSSSFATMGNSEEDNELDELLFSFDNIKDK